MSHDASYSIRSDTSSDRAFRRMHIMMTKSKPSDHHDLIPLMPAPQNDGILKGCMFDVIDTRSRALRVKLSVDATRSAYHIHQSRSTPQQMPSTEVSSEEPRRWIDIVNPWIGNRSQTWQTIRRPFWVSFCAAPLSLQNNA